MGRGGAWPPPHGLHHAWRSLPALLTLLGLRSGVNPPTLPPLPRRSAPAPPASRSPSSLAPAAEAGRLPPLKLAGRLPLKLPLRPVKELCRPEAAAASELRDGPGQAATRLTSS